MPERPPRRAIPEPKGPEASERTLGQELKGAILELITAIPENVKEVARKATDLRTKLLERRLHATGGIGQLYSEAVQAKLDQLQISPEDFENARMLVTVPSVDFPETLQAIRRRVRELIIDSVDEQIKGKGDLCNFFPDPQLHQADLYQISYEYTAAHDRLEQRRDQGRDSLTGLINDQGFLTEVFEVELKLLALLEESRTMAVFRVDLDGFKAINDQHGHREGDRVLKEFAENLRQKFRRSFDITSILPERDSNSTEARPGGDEFVLIVNDIDMQAPVDIQPSDYAHYPTDFVERHGVGNPMLFEVAKRIMEAAGAVQLPGGSRLSASIGYARIHQQDAGRMLYGIEGDQYRRQGFEFYNHAADIAAMNAKEWGDGVAKEWAPYMPAVPMTPERLLRNGRKRFKRDYPDLPIDSEIEIMLQQQAEFLARKYAALSNKE